MGICQVIWLRNMMNISETPRTSKKISNFFKHPLYYKSIKISRIKQIFFCSQHPSYNIIWIIRNFKGKNNWIVLGFTDQFLSLSYWCCRLPVVSLTGVNQTDDIYSDHHLANTYVTSPIISNRVIRDFPWRSFILKTLAVGNGSGFSRATIIETRVRYAWQIWLRYRPSSIISRARGQRLLSHEYRQWQMNSLGVWARTTSIVHRLKEIISKITGETSTWLCW